MRATRKESRESKLKSRQLVTLPPMVLILKRTVPTVTPSLHHLLRSRPVSAQETKHLFAQLSNSLKHFPLELKLFPGQVNWHLEHSPSLR